MPDPPNAKQPTDTAAAAEHAAPHRGDQVPGNAPCTRTAAAAAGSGAARSRSSYSGNGGAAGASNALVPLARSGSTTTNTRVQSLAQVGPQHQQHHTAVRNVQLFVPHVAGQGGMPHASAAVPAVHLRGASTLESNPTQ
jgi:hypothetical protein